MSNAPAPSVVGILGFGAMGEGVARVLKASGLEIATCVTDRSRATQGRAQAAGVTGYDTLRSLVDHVDTFLSIVPADQAVPLAEAVAASCEARDRPLHYVDCNSITPRKTQQIAEIVQEAGLLLSDAGIIGPPPVAGRNRTRFYTSGPHRHVLAALGSPEMSVIPLGDGLTEATQMKVLFAAINKGTVALLMNVLAAAKQANLVEAIVSEADAMRPGLLDVARRQAGDLASKSARWAIEMVDLAEALSDLGTDGGYHATAAESYRRLAENIAADAAATGAAPPETLDEVLLAWTKRRSQS